jgi:hypothetical protein
LSMQETVVPYADNQQSQVNPSMGVALQYP